MPSILELKKQQKQATEKRGEPNPYEQVIDAFQAKQVPTPQRPAGLKVSRIDLLKAKQLEANPNAYAVKPTLIDVDIADGPDVSTSVTFAGTGKELFEQLQAAMVTDVARIKTKPVLEDKQEIKGDLLPNYLPFVLAYVADGHNYPNDVAVQVMVWLFDVNNIEDALKIGTYLVTTGTNDLPEKFSRSLPGFMSDEVYQWANAQLKADQTASPYLDDFVAFIDNDELVEKWELHPLVVSQSLNMLAKHKEREGKLAECVALCERAEAVNPEGAGVKTMKERAQKALAKQIDSPTTNEEPETE